MVIYNQTEKTLKNLPHRTGGKGAEKGEKMRKDTVEVREDTVEVREDTVEVRLEGTDNEEERPCNCGSGVHWAFCPANSPYCG